MSEPKYRSDRQPSLGAGRVLFITKEGEEGLLTIDEGTGGPLTPIDDVPEWASNLASAMLAERMKFYINRLGVEAAASIISASTIDVGDLDWVTVDEETGELVHKVEAEPEVRSGILAEKLGITVAEAQGMVTAQHKGAREIIDQFDLDKTQVLTPEQSKAQTAEMIQAGQGFKNEKQAQEKATGSRR